MAATSKPRELTHTGQPFYDRAVYAELARPTRLATALMSAFPGGETLGPIMEQRGFERVKINWVRPGPDGNLLPR
jgi:hypothetical protein